MVLDQTITSFYVTVLMHKRTGTPSLADALSPEERICVRLLFPPRRHESDHCHWWWACRLVRLPHCFGAWWPCVPAGKGVYLVALVFVAFAHCCSPLQMPFCGGNSTKATSGINGTLTRTQIKEGVKDSVEAFLQVRLHKSSMRCK